ncbi:hypothetical protein M758_7G135200, partial [Ceratodon purpureus]
RPRTPAFRHDQHASWRHSAPSSDSHVGDISTLKTRGWRRGQQCRDEEHDPTLDIGACYSWDDLVHLTRPIFAFHMSQSDRKRQMGVSNIGHLQFIASEASFTTLQGLVQVCSFLLCGCAIIG